VIQAYTSGCVGHIDRSTQVRNSPVGCSAAQEIGPERVADEEALAGQADSLAAVLQQSQRYVSAEGCAAEGVEGMAGAGGEPIAGHAFHPPQSEHEQLAGAVFRG
jgi:hypothetical protein